MSEWNLDYQYLATLVDRAKQGDSDAFSELYLATYKKIYRFAYQYLHNEQDAQDAMQETYIIVLRKIATLKDPSLFVSWINQVAFRVCFGMQKKQKEPGVVDMGMEELDQKPASSEVHPETIAINVDEKRYIMKQVMALPFSESRVITLFYYKNMKIEEIAQMLEISRSTVKRYLKSGKEKLARMVKR